MQCTAAPTLHCPEAAPARSRLKGTRIARHGIVAELGADGMGVVYRGHDESLRSDVALTLLPAELAPHEPSRRRQA